MTVETDWKERPDLRFEVVLTSKGKAVSSGTASTVRGAQAAATTMAHDATEAGYAYRMLEAMLLLDGVAVVSSVVPHQLRVRAEEALERARAS
jgi:hypothetical protein